MKLSILTVGKPAEPFYLRAVEEYLKRSQRYLQIEWLIAPPSSGKQSVERILSSETQTLLKLVKPRDHIVLLDVEGKKFNSRSFSSWLEGTLGEVSGRLVFVIGGPYGIGEELKTRSDLMLSLSDMTLPHELCLVFLTEQIYRALSIIAGSSYHH